MEARHVKVTKDEDADFAVNIVRKLIIANMATVRDSEVTSDKFNLRYIEYQFALVLPKLGNRVTKE
jgi:hypothetical protein